MRAGYLDRSGVPITTARWAELFETPGYRLVARSEFDDGSFLSTVWLGIDHAYDMGPPMIFESMFMPDAEHQTRYSTEQEALEGHALLLQVLLATGRRLA